VAIVLVYIFAVQLHWLPALPRIRSGQSLSTFLTSITLPAITLVLAIAPYIIRMTRNAILNALSSPYIEMAVLKGVPRYGIIWRHALPNAVGPIINSIALMVAYLLTGVVVVEAVFGYPGIGRLMVDGVAARDMPIIQACALIFATIYVGLNLVADILSILSNPRLRFQR
jgi:peptide/nickel transport system permease protein